MRAAAQLTSDRQAPLIRRVEPELLDELPVSDAAAQRSRRDLERINGVMGNARILARALRQAFPNRPPATLLELGAGDGTLLARVARQLPRAWAGVRATLLDRQPTLSPRARGALGTQGWQIEAPTADAFSWLEREALACDVMVANLFLHHFDAGRLTRLLALASRRTRVFIAVEPRRSRAALWASRLVGLIGGNAITRHDAPVSVRAGFNGEELSRFWPAQPGWRLREVPAGWSSHLFVAERDGFCEGG